MRRISETPALVNRVVVGDSATLGLKFPRLALSAGIIIALCNVGEAALILASVSTLTGDVGQVMLATDADRLGGRLGMLARAKQISAFGGETALGSISFTDVMLDMEQDDPKVRIVLAGSIIRTVALL
jgi:hypothetical protein